MKPTYLTPKSRPSSHQRGLSLIEMMIAMALGLFVASAGMYLFSGSWKQSRNTKNVIEGADTAQIALAQVAADIRSVNFLGCGRNLGNNVAVPALSQSVGNDFADYLIGLLPINAGPRPFLPSNAFVNVLPNGSGVAAATAQNPIKILKSGSAIGVTVTPTSIGSNDGSPDGLILVRANPDVRQISENSRSKITQNSGQQSSLLPTASRIGDVNDKDMHLFALHSCGGADIFYGQYETNSSSNIALDSVSNQAVSALLNAELRIDYPAGSTITNLIPVAYFVGTSSNANIAAVNGPTLYQVQLESPAAGGFRRWGTPQPLANWVNGFRVELGVDTDEDGEANLYRRSTAITATDVVVSARVTLEVLSEANTAVEAATAGTLAAQNTQAQGNGTQRRIVTTRSMVVQLRNGR